MQISALRTSQAGLRLNSENRAAMARFVAQGGIFIPRSSADRLIAIDRFPDGALYLRDGLHRAVAILLARPSRTLHSGEYRVLDRTYQMYLEADVRDGWVTPFDPRTEVRFADFLAFKSGLVQHCRDGGDPLRFISERRHEYCRARTAQDTLECLAADWC